MYSDKEEKQIRSLDANFSGRNFDYLGYEYCANPVCKVNPLDYDCPYVCDTSAHTEKIDISDRYFMNLRRGFIARSGFSLVSIDYSQIELRIAANMSNEPSWVTSFVSGEDLHRNVAKACFKTDDPSDKQRKLTKGFNFGSLYGGGAGTISAATGIPLEEAQSLLVSWKEAVPVLQVWMQQVRKEARKMGYAISYFGRRRYLETYYKSKDKELIASADRYAVNHVVQGCLQGRSRVLTDSGYLKIIDLYTGKAFAKTVWDGEGWREFEVLNRGKAKKTNVTLDTGRVVHVDNRHKFFKHDLHKSSVEIHIDELTTDDRLCSLYPYSPFEFNTHTSNPASKTAWYLFGYILKDPSALNALLGEEHSDQSLQSTWNNFLQHIDMDVFEYFNTELGFNITDRHLPERLFSESLDNRFSFFIGMGDEIVFDDESILADIALLADTIGVVLKISGNKLVPHMPTHIDHRFDMRYGSREISNITYLEEEEDTYTLSVKHPNHRFFADGILHKNTAADLLKISLLNAHDLIQKNNWQNDVRILLTVHDEIDFEVRDSMLEEVISKLRPVMEFKLKKWPVPLTVDVEVSKDWGSVEKYALVKSRFEKQAAPEILPKDMYYVIPHRLDELQVQILEAILNEHKGANLLSFGYDGHIIDLNVDDPKQVALKLREKKLIL